ncbi:MAG: hypothetical protein CSA22_04145 [Deltaproteobacteria bacterium]|nr:MAG: hypothetical protein CSA22_04145 [Deltaproteobacteria bacterium]
MISVDEFKNNHVLGNLSDAMLEKIIPLTDVLAFRSREYVFKHGESADHFYMLKRGKVLIEQRVSPFVTVSVGSLAPGESFGWDAVSGEAVYKLDSICVEASEVYTVNRDAFLALMEKDLELGFRMMRLGVSVLKKRLDHRTDQFVRALHTHPEIHELSELPE